MRTTLDLPDGLVEEAQKLLGLKSKTDTVAASLRELIRRREVEQLKGLFGKVRVDYDLAKMRRRP